MRVPGIPRVRPAFGAALAIGFVLLAITRLATPYMIQHTSMEPSFEPGEIVLVEAAGPPLAELTRGDIVVFNPPVAAYAGPPFIKRLIAFAGETVEIRDGFVLVDGQRLIEPYTRGTTGVGSGPASWRVPAGSVFVLGDNREDSWDSRGYGPVPVSGIVGRVWLAYRPATSVSLLAVAQPVRLQPASAADQPSSIRSRPLGQTPPTHSKNVSSYSLHERSWSRQYRHTRRI